MLLLSTRAKKAVTSKKKPSATAGLIQNTYRSKEKEL